LPVHLTLSSARKTDRRRTKHSSRELPHYIINLSSSHKEKTMLHCLATKQTDKKKEESIGKMDMDMQHSTCIRSVGLGCNGRTFIGNNIEAITYPRTCCGIRAATADTNTNNTNILPQQQQQ
jgi:hypothetical protein